MASLLKVDTIENAAGTGAPSADKGLQITGLTAGSQAAAGAVGQVLTTGQVTGSGTYTTAYTQFASLSLTAGNWLLIVTAAYSGGGQNANSIDLAVGTTTASAAGTTFGVDHVKGFGNPTNGVAYVNATKIVSISSTTTYFANISTDNSTLSGTSLQGAMQAIRIS